MVISGHVSALRGRTVVVALLAVLALGLVSRAAPEPEAIPRRWQLDIDPGPLRVMSVEVPGRPIATYFFLTYRVTNNSGQDVIFSPLFELAQDDGVIIRGGRNVPPEVSDVVLNRLGNSLIATEAAIQGTLLQGPENARQGVVIWPATNLKVDEVVVYAEGFSGETKSILRPDTKEKVVLRKTLMLRHRVPGEIDPSSSAALDRSLVRWVMR